MFKPSETDWDAYYLTTFPLAHLTRRITLSRIIASLSTTKSLNPGGKILEIGAGNSFLFRTLSKHYNPKKYVAIDKNAIGLQQLLRGVGVHSVSIQPHHPLEVLLADILEVKGSGDADLVISVGLIEHFLPDETRKVIEKHFEFARPGGLVLITFPTPTFLYRATRWVCEALRAWQFHDERPLSFAEVLQAVNTLGKVQQASIIWPIMLTQGVLVAQKNDV